MYHDEKEDKECTVEIFMNSNMVYAVQTLHTVEAQTNISYFGLSLSESIAVSVDHLV